MSTTNNLPSLKEYRTILYANLTWAIQHCSIRGLTEACDWMAELLESIQPELNQQEHNDYLFNLTPSNIQETKTSPLKRKITPLKTNSVPFQHKLKDQSYLVAKFDQTYRKTSDVMNDIVYMRAKAWFDQKEFLRCQHYLDDSKANNEVLVFLKYYSKLKVGLNKLQAKHVPSESPLSFVLKDHHTPYNLIYNELSQIYLIAEDKDPTTLTPEEKASQDPFILYLLGQAAVNTNNKEFALEVLLKSVESFPYNWQAWLALGKCIKSLKHLNLILDQLSPTFMKQYFLVHTCSQFQLPEEEIISRSSELVTLFPESQDMKLKLGITYYHYKNYDAAFPLLEDYFQNNPYSLTDIDLYSHVLFLKRDEKRLGQLMEQCSAINPNRPETQCVFSNFYALQNNQTKALEFSTKAVELDNLYLEGWLLMATTLVQLKKYKGALEAYAKAGDIEPRDYRSWVGMGRMYEILQMKDNATKSYAKALAIRPKDARLWNLCGEMYEQLNLTTTAINCYLQVLDHNSTITNQAHYIPPHQIHLKLGKLYHHHPKNTIYNSEFGYKTAYHYRTFIEGIKPQPKYSKQEAEAFMYLAEFEMSRENFHHAEMYCQHVLNYSEFDEERPLKISKVARELINIEESIDIEESNQRETNDDEKFDLEDELDDLIEELLE